MSGEREELKGKLLLLWIEDLRNDKEPEVYPEMKSLAPSEVEEIMGLARFIKTTLYPSETLPANIADYAKRLSERGLEEQAKQVELNRMAIQEAATFGELIRATISSLRIDRNALQELLTLPRLTLSALEAGEMPPHRLPMDKMVRLLYALRLASKEVVGLIRRSSLEWAKIAYGRGLTQLGRTDVLLKDEARQSLMEQREDLPGELERIESFCSRLSTILP